MNAPETLPQHEFKNHDLVDDFGKPGVRYEKRPARRPDGSVAAGLFNAWIQCLKNKIRGPRRG